jgi:hypothetical protein
VRLCLTFLALLTARTIAAGCVCPERALSQHLLVAVSAGKGGIVACGYEEERRADAVVASGFEIFRCGEQKPFLEFDALQTAVLRAKAGVLQVTEIERWPFGKQWQWVPVPVYEWHLSARNPQPRLRRTLRATPTVAPHEIAAFLAEYRRWLSVPEDARSYRSAEEYVARLFTSAVSGNAEAERLFLAMRRDAGLDGAAGVIHSMALGTFNAWREPRVRLRKE